VDGLAACIARRVVGAVLVVFLWRNVPNSAELINKKQGNLEKGHAAKINKPM
jgi:hypothetical protein